MEIDKQKNMLHPLWQSNYAIVNIRTEQQSNSASFFAYNLAVQTSVSKAKEGILRTDKRHKHIKSKARTLGRLKIAQLPNALFEGT